MKLTPELLAQANSFINPIKERQLDLRGYKIPTIENLGVTRLGDLEPLKELRKLKYLSLLGNPVREKKWYREWLAWRIPGLRVLDFQRIRDKERQTAKALFLTADNLPTALATTISSTVSTQSSKALVTTDEPKPAPMPGKAGRLMSKEDAEKVKAAIAKASSMEEVRRLERSLREGYMPEMESVGA
ncbi:leucine-rich repeat-domain-containing protein [Mycena amicta]|nr:leucine-rich repeat-domain-containing protein [Mycena amicta]